MQLLLVHSPYLGPSSWGPTAGRLRDLGHAVAVPDLRSAALQEPAGAGLIRALGETLDHVSGPAVVLGHSRSGPYLPAAAHGRDVAALVYVDAALPHPGRSWADVAPLDRVDRMRRLIAGGQIPRWCDWWGDRSVVEGLVPDVAQRERLVDEMSSLPEGFLDEPLPDLSWAGAAGYLQLSPSYADVADEAAAAGWPVERRPLDHLAILTAPDAVASAVVSLLAALAV